MNPDNRLANLPPAALARVGTDKWTQPFWQAALTHQLMFPRCSACGLYRMPPTPFCPRCRSQKTEWIEASGDAILYSYTIVERATVAGLTIALPYVPAIVEYPEADKVRLITNIVGSPLSEIAVGRNVNLGWHDIDERLALPIFCMASGQRVASEKPSIGENA